MRHPVVVVGIGAEGPEGLTSRARARIASATFLAGGKRHLDLIGSMGAETFAITNNVDELSERLRCRESGERCVVLASGDPLFFGIGHRLGEALGRDQIVIEPAISSMQLAFARAACSWHDATIASIHGRPMAEVLLPLLGRPKIGLFTTDGSSPARVAAFFLERGLERYTAFVGENLGASNETTSVLPLRELLDRRFSDLNVLLLIREDTPPPSVPPCIPDDRFAQPEAGPILLTHRDVRAIVLARFSGLPAGPLWDLGAGLGGVAIGLGRMFPEREVVAVERSAVQAGYLGENRRRFEAYNVRIVNGSAPEVVAGESPPAGVFLGGSGGRLDAILDLVFDRIQPGGVFVANFVGLENMSRCRERLRNAGWESEVTQLQINEGQALAGLTVLTPQRPVWVVRSVRPDL
jgi:precorrin-6Y C5,15-methyltransferase (decarboxylating)